MAIKTQYRVDIFERERGYGERLEKSEYFSTMEDAISYAKEVNYNNTNNEVPDTYWYAAMPIKIEYDGEIGT